MTEQLRAKGVNMEIEFLGEKKFARELSKILADKYNYRVDLSPDQFV